MGLITLGLSEIRAGKLNVDGGEATSYTKIGKTYQNTCKLQQDNADVTEHFEEGQSAPEVRKKRKKVPILKFSIMDPDPDFLKEWFGGKVDGSSDEKNGAGAIRMKLLKHLSKLSPRLDWFTLFREVMWRLCLMRI